MIYLANIDLNQNQLLNAVIQPLAVAPSAPKLGQIYTDSTTSKIKWYDGTAWKTIGVVVESSAANGNIVVDGVEMQVYTLPIASASTLGGIRVYNIFISDTHYNLTHEQTVANGTELISFFADTSTAKIVIGVYVDSTGADTGMKYIGNYNNSNSIWFDLGNSIIQLANIAGSFTMFTSSIVQTASASTLGGIKVGTGLAIDGNGVLSATQGGTADSVEWSGVLNKPAVAIDSNYVHTDNNFTTGEKNKLAGVAAGAEVNVNSDWNASSGDAQILNKPTTLSTFVNDENFIDNTVENLVNYYKKSETYTKVEVGTLISQIATIQISVVSALPASGASNVIYLIPKAGGSTQNVKDEYLWTGTAFEKIGDTEISLVNMLEKTGDLATTTVTFDTAVTRVLPVSTEATANIIGKITRYLTDLKTVAFTGNYDDLSNKPREFVLLTAQIQAGQTSAFIATNYVPVSIKAHDSMTGETVIVDSVFDTSSAPNGITINIAQAYNHTIVVLAMCPVSA